MKISSVHDLTFADVASRHYDLALFASGFEARARHVASLIDPVKVRLPVVLGFANYMTETERVRNDEFFSSRFVQPHVARSADDADVFDALRAIPAATLIRVLVDYSSMSRIWYTAPLNWARMQADAAAVQIDFVYSTGRYPRPVRRSIVGDITTIPGCEGGPVQDLPAVAIFGLGWDPLAPFAVLEKLEPRFSYAFVARPADDGEQTARTLAINKEFIEEHTDNGTALVVPLDSVRAAYAILGEFVAVHRTSTDVSIVPLGPKPHVLASALLAMQFPSVSCLRVSRDEGPDSIDPAGTVVATRVEVTR